MANGFWEEFKKLFKTKQQVAEEKAQAIGEANSREQEELIGKLAELESELATLESKKDTKEDYSEIFPEELNLQKVDYTAKTADEIKTEAENELGAQYVEQKNSVNQSISDKAEEYAENLENAAQSKQATLEEIDKLYQSLKTAAENDAVKRGLARSSIITDTLRDYDFKKADSSEEIVKQYDAAVNEIQANINALEGERKKSLEQLDLAYVKELDKRINELTSEQSKLAAEAAEANNEIERQQIKYKAERAKNIEEYESRKKAESEEAAEKLAAYEAEYGYSGAKQQNYASRYNLALEFYLTLDPDIALQAFDSSSNMKYYLGNYYDNLYKVLQDRAAASDKYQS